MKVAVFGGTGFVGGYLLDALVEHGHEPAVLVRSGSERRLRRAERCRAVSGEIDDPEAVTEVLTGCDAAIYNIGILREQPRRGVTYRALQVEGARRTMALAEELGARRYLLMSANGVKPSGTPYQTTKHQAEEHLRATALDWTVFRPSVIFGDPRGRMEFASRLYEDVIRMPMPAPLFHAGVLPFGAGRFRLAPIHARDVATVFTESLQMPETVRQVYALCGPDALEWREILRIIARAAGRSGKLALPAPAWAVKAAAAVFERFESFPITRDEITMLMEGNTCESNAAIETFGIDPVRFDAQGLAYLAGGGRGRS